MRRFEELEEFKRWFDNKPLRHPDIAITASLARNIARLVYEREQEIMKMIDNHKIWANYDMELSIKRLKEEINK